MADDIVFLGFPATLEEGYTQMPNEWFNILLKINNMAELKVVLYVIRHTWGFQDADGERDIYKKITTDEFAYGRRRKDGTRFDGGTGLGLTAVKEGAKKAIEHGYLFCEVDDSDLARIKKHYGLNLLAEDTNSDGRNPTTDSHNLATNGHNPTTRETYNDDRSEKETRDKNLAKETCVKEALSPFFLQALSFIKEREEVTFADLEKYMHRFMRVRGHTSIDMKHENLVAWTGSSPEFLWVLIDLQNSGHIYLALTDESRYSKGRRPHLPVTDKEEKHETLHWYPMILIYK
jgi:hypothetical protein